MVILPGVTIGRGCTVAAGSVVTRDIEEYSVAMGAPARVVRKVEPLELKKAAGEASEDRQKARET